MLTRGPMLARGTTFAVLTAALLLAGCASSGEDSGPGRSRNLITAAELMEVPHSTVYEAVRALRPRWLQARAGATFSSRELQTAMVYIDGQLRGGLDEMHTLVPVEVGELRFMSASDATTRFGTNHIGGAIVITTRR